MSPVEPLKEVPGYEADAPLVRRISIEVASSAATVDTSQVFQQIPFNGIITGVAYAPSGNITGEASNNRTLAVSNKGSAASGGSAIASRLTTATLTGLIENEIALSEAEPVVHAGDVLVWSSTHHSSGCVDPGGSVTITVSRHLVEVPKEQPGL